LTKNPHPGSADLESLRNRGWRLLDEKRYDEAIEAFAQVFQRDRLDVAAFQGTIAAHRKKRSFAAAEELLAEALHAHPRHPGILSERAWLDLEQKRYDAAIEAFSEVLAIDGKNEGIHLWRISLLRAQRRFAEAERSFEQADRLFPGSLRLLVERGWLSFYQQRYDEAFDTFARVLRTDPRNESAWQGRIAALRRKGCYAEALRLAEEALARLGASPGLYGEQGWIHFEQGRYEDAEADFRAAAERAPEDAGARVNVAWALVRQGGDDALARATASCRQALQLDPELATAFGCLGVIAFKQGRIREAEAYLLRSIRADPANGCYADLGALYVQMGRYDEAKTTLGKALESSPDDAYAHGEMGKLYLKTDQVREAIREFRQAAASDPHHPDPNNALAIALMENGRLVEAERVLRGALQSLDPALCWELRLTLCRLLTRVGDNTGDALFYRDALKEATAAIRLQPERPEPQFHSGIVRFKLEDYSGALNAFRRCLQSDELHLDAEINARRIQALRRQEKKDRRVSTVASAGLFLLLLAQLVALWVLHLTTAKLSSTMLTVLVPILLGLMVISLLLPWLSRLKMTGLEADLSEPEAKESLAAGPKGEIGFGNALGRSV
jgi:tetratricopeptide (TPR) repeat protein